MHTNNGIESKVISQIEKLGIQYEWLPVDPKYADTEKFCREYGFTKNESGNTIIVKSKRGPKIYSACLVLAVNKLDVNKKVKSLLEVSRLSFAKAEETTKLTNMLVGGVTVVGLPENLPIYIDSNVMRETRIIIGGGSRSGKIILPSSELTKIPNVQIIDELALSKE